MPASEKSLEKIKDLEEDRRHDFDAKREWDKLVKAYDQAKGTRTPPDPKGAELRALIEQLAQKLDRDGKSIKEEIDDCSGCNENDHSLTDSDKLMAGIDLDNLAELVFERLIFEVRIERDRVGWSA